MSATKETVRCRCGHLQTFTLALDTKAERVALAATLATGYCSSCDGRRLRAKARAKGIR
jgi:hypothetical protein